MFKKWAGAQALPSLILFNVPFARSMRGTVVTAILLFAGSGPRKRSHDLSSNILYTVSDMLNIAIARDRAFVVVCLFCFGKCRGLTFAISDFVRILQLHGMVHLSVSRRLLPIRPQTLFWSPNALET